MPRELGGRLALALTLSVLIHAWLLGGVRLGRVQWPEATSHTIQARLAPDELRPSLGVAPPASVDRVALPKGKVPGAPSPPPDTTPAMAPATALSAQSARSEPLPPDSPEFDPRPPLDVPLVIDATVYAPHDLDVIPLPQDALAPPAVSEMAGAGIITLELVVDERGHVREGRVVEVEPPHYPADATLQVFRSARFSPAEREGRPVRARIAIKVEYGSEGASPVANP